MVLTLQSSRHFPSAVATQTMVSADGTRSVPASLGSKYLALAYGYGGADNRG